MIKKNKYLEYLEKYPAIAKYFPDDLTAPIDLWPREQVAAYQTEAVKELLEHSFAHCQFYREKFDAAGVTPNDFRSLVDLQRFPFTFKRELQGKPWLLLAVAREEIAQIHMSTGTTSTGNGDHIYRLYSWDDIYINEIAIRMPLMSPNRVGDVVAVALPYEMSSAGLSFHRAFQNSAKTMVVNVGKGGFYSDPLKTVLVLRDLSANILITTPAYAVYLAEIAKEHGIDLARDVGLKLLWLTGEGSSNAFRERLERLWGCVALRYYGSLECGPLGIECVVQDGYHVPEGHVLLEVVDPDTGRVLPPGMVGELCATVLYRRGAPLIRYRLEDMGYLETSDCPCCIERPRVVLRGRKQDQVHVGSQWLSPYYIEEMLYRLPEVGNSYQLLITEDGLTVHVELAQGVDRSQSVADKIKLRLESGLGEVKDVVLVDKLPRTGGKSVRVRYA